MQPIGTPDADEVVRRALREASFWRRTAAVHALATAPLPIGPLREALRDDDPTLRRRAVRLLPAWVARLPEAESLLRQALRDPAWPVRRAAVQGLAGNPTASGDLATALADPDPGVREAAVEALAGASVPGAVEALGNCLADPDEDVRFAAAQTLKQYGCHAIGALEALRAALRDEAERVRVAAAGALEGLWAEAAEPDLLALLADGRREVRLAAVRALGEVGSAAAGAALLPLLGQEAEVAEALGRIGRRTAGLEAELLAVLEEGPSRKRQGAALALARLGSAAGRARLAEMLRHRRPRLRCQAVLALGAFDAVADAVLPDMLRALADSHSRVRQAAARALAGWGVQAAPALALLLRRRYDRAPRARRAATETLARLLPKWPAEWQPWLRLLAAPGATASRNLRRALAEPGLPEDVRREFLAACSRRTRWHAGHRHLTAMAEELPPESVWQAARRAARAGGPGEHAWLVAFLWSLLVQQFPGHPRQPEGR
jgi:HEAT repeat protein